MIPLVLFSATEAALINLSLCNWYLSQNTIAIKATKEEMGDLDVRQEVFEMSSDSRHYNINYHLTPQYLNQGRSH